LKKANICFSGFGITLKDGAYEKIDPYIRANDGNDENAQKKYEVAVCRFTGVE